jgi:hypothetical protein
MSLFFCSFLGFTILLRRNNPTRAKAASLQKLLDHTQLDTPRSVGLLWTSDRRVAKDL